MASLLSWISSWWGAPKHQQIELSEQDAVSRMKEWTSASQSLSILVVGKTGAGKSTLINSLIGMKVAVEGKNLRAETTVVKPCSVQINGVKVTLWDTPGLRDPLVMTDPRKTIDMIAQDCKHYDLFLYCIPMDDRRLASDDADAVSELTKSFGTGIWENAVLALTCANELNKPPDCSQEMPAYFASRHSEWIEVIREAFVKQGVSISTANGIPVVPTGHKDCSLYGNPDWFSTFWTAAFLRVRKEAKPAMLIVNRDRLVSGEQMDTKPMEPHEKPIAITRVTPLKAVGVTTVALAKPVIGVGGGAVIGAAIGVFVGAIGGPATATLAAALGAKVGGGIGVVAGGGTIAGLIGAAILDLLGK